jgi:hypothetical protein
MVRRRSVLSVAWTRLAERQLFAPAVVSEGVRQFAHDVVVATADACRAKVHARGVAPSDTAPL